MTIPPSPPTLTLVIITYGREQVLIDTLAHLLAQTRGLAGFAGLLVVDQTPKHEPGVEAQLGEWQRAGCIRWLRLNEPHLTHAMNVGLLEAQSDLVLYTDDDIIPAPGLIVGHQRAYAEFPEADAVVGQILQPGETPRAVAFTPHGDGLRRYLDFPFYSTEGGWVENVIACNLSVRRASALRVGGFDEAFGPPVASRFETEFAKRLVAAGGRIRFEPRAALRHLQAGSGGTRSKGGHLASPSPRYGVGDYYYAFRHGRGLGLWTYVLRRPFREIRTRFHLRQPWYMPVKLVGELRALVAGWRLARRAPLTLRRF